MNETVLEKEEKIICDLRYLYHQHGYMPYSMSKFEDYEFYMQNKDFLVSDRVIAFNDTNGKMLALKPDVTLSVIKSGKDKEGVKQKVYYNENVYRVSKTTHRYKEIMQAGLECIGDIDFYDIYEVISLAAESLKKISSRFSLVISHLGILSDILKDACDNPVFQKEAVQYISKKNTHDLLNLCDEYKINEEKKNALFTLTDIGTDRNEAIKKIKEISASLYIPQLKNLSDFITKSPYSENIQFDFSVADDFNYYNGFLFKGYIDGVSSEVLSGGQYDNMMKKINRTSKAVGFAIYLDLLEKNTPADGYDFDVLLLYNENNNVFSVAQKVREYTDSGLSCSAQKTVPEKIRFKEIIDIRKDG